MTGAWKTAGILQLACSVVQVNVTLLPEVGFIKSFESHIY